MSFKAGNHPVHEILHYSRYIIHIKRCCKNDDISFELLQQFLHIILNNAFSRCFKPAGKTPYAMPYFLVGQNAEEGNGSHFQAAVLTCWSMVHGLASLWVDGPLRAAESGKLEIEKLADLILGQSMTYRNF